MDNYEYDFELPPTVSELESQFGPINYGGLVHENGPARDFNDENVDTSIFPYYTKGPLPAPIPTPAEITALKEMVRGKRMGPYVIKTGYTVDIFQVSGFV